MTILDFFWIFLMLSALQPVLRRQMLEGSRQRLLAKVEHMRGSRVIALIHRQETMSFLGFPVFRYININDSEEVIRAIHMTGPDVPVDIVLHTPGGLVLAALQIARALRRHPAKVTVFVPHYAMSGGTLIALAADEIVMCEHAVLGPVDPQLGEYPAASVLKIVKEKPVERIDDRTLILADTAEKAIRQVQAAVREILAGRYPDDTCEELAKVLTEGRWTHDYPITYEEAKRLGLPVSAEMPNEVLKLMQLYPQPVNQARTVEYLPFPRHRGPVAPREEG